MAPYIVIFIRLVVPFSILRWPFGGMLLSIAADAGDVILLDVFGWGIFEGKGIYHELDKIFDMYYLSFAFYKSFGWQEILARRTSLVLFVWRFAGFIIFELTHVRQVIFFAPNIFENFYLLAAGADKFIPNWKLDSKKKLLLFILIAAIPKMIQEYIMHYLEFPTWQFIKYNIFRWH